MRVALDASVLVGELGGPGVAFQHLLAGLCEHEDLELSVFALGLKRGDLAVWVPREVEHTQGNLPPRLTRVLWQSINRPTVKTLSGPVDVVHDFGCIVPPRGAMPMLISVHHATALTDEALATPRERSRLHALRRAVDGGAFVHTSTQAVKDVLVDGLGLPASRIVVIPFGTPSLVPKNPAAVDQWLPPSTDRYIVAIGEDLPRKGFRYLLQAFADVADEDSRLGLVLIGRCTPQQREDVTRLRHGNRIIRTGPLSSPQAGTLLHGAAALVYPSLSEGFGFPPLQAMAAGVPVIASDLPALREVAGDAALFAKPRDAGGLAHALSVLLHNSALQRDLIIRGRNRIENFRFETSAAQFAEIYRLLHARR